MRIQRIAAFSDGSGGGNPAGIVLADAMPPEDAMRRIAREVGYSETAFAAPLAEGASSWRVRYFAPEADRRPEPVMASPAPAVEGQPGAEAAGSRSVPPRRLRAA